MLHSGVLYSSHSPEHFDTSTQARSDFGNKLQFSKVNFGLGLRIDMLGIYFRTYQRLWEKLFGASPVGWARHIRHWPSRDVSYLSLGGALLLSVTGGRGSATKKEGKRKKEWCGV
jgi:hypothetical protein